MPARSPLIRSCLPLVVILGSLTTHAQADSLTVGTANQGQQFPFVNAGFYQLERYQQHYKAASFGASPLNIQSFSLASYNGIGAGSALPPGTFDIYFSYSVHPFNADTANLSGNVGADETFFGRFVVPSTAPAVLTISGTAPFLYDPRLGDLLLDVRTIATPSPFVAAVYYNSDLSGSAILGNYSCISSLYCTSATNQSAGFVTTFQSSPAAFATPEPPAVALATPGLIFFALVLRLYRRRRSV